MYMQRTIEISNQSNIGIKSNVQDVAYPIFAKLKNMLKNEINLLFSFVIVRNPTKQSYVLFTGQFIRQQRDVELLLHLQSTLSPSS